MSRAAWSLRQARERIRELEGKVLTEEDVKDLMMGALTLELIARGADYADPARAAKAIRDVLERRTGHAD